LKKKNKIAIIGPYPPPYGGISVHIQRVIKYLPKDRYVLFNTSNSKCEGAISFYGKVKYLKVFQFIFKKYKLIHTHSTDTYLRMIFGFIGIFRKNIYLHIHGASLSNLLHKRGMVSFIMKPLIKNLHIIVVNSEIVREIIKYKPISIHKIDAFLPPTFNQKVFKSKIQKHKEFFKKDRFIISMTGWFHCYKDEDLYGFDIAGKVIKKFIDQGNKIYLAACVNGIIDNTIYDLFIKLLNENNLEEQILLIQGESDIWPYILCSQLFVRATNTDGSSISIKEAQWFGVPVIASDCVVRPSNVILFKNRSENDLYKKVKTVYRKPHISFYEKIVRYYDNKFENQLLSDIYKI